MTVWMSLSLWKHGGKGWMLFSSKELAEKHAEALAEENGMTRISGDVWVDGEHISRTEVREEEVLEKWTSPGSLSSWYSTL